MGRNMAIEEDPERYEAAAFTSAGVSFTTCRVLEIGCGDGRLTKRYADVAASVIAVDPDTQALAALATELPFVDSRPVAFDELVLPAHSVDVVRLRFLHLRRHDRGTSRLHFGNLEERADR